MLKQIIPLLQVSDLKASVLSYGGKLGFRTGSIDGGFSVVRRDNCTIYLAQKTKADGVAECRRYKLNGAMPTAWIWLSKDVENAAIKDSDASRSGARIDGGELAG